MTQGRAVRLIGAASSAGAYGPGQEAAPATFRCHGLISALEGAGCAVRDVGDVAQAEFQLDADHPEASNVEAVANVARAVSQHVAEALGDGVPVLVLGGDCTVELGTLSGALEGSPSVALVYIDGDTDLNTPATGDGILDWMGVAHMLSLPGAVPALTHLANRTPMLTPDALRFVAADNINDAEQRVVDELGLKQHSLTECRNDLTAVIETLTTWSASFDRLLVHVDIDVLGGAAFPIADNTRTIEGLELRTLGQLLRALCNLPNFSALTLCEVNPDNAQDKTAQFGELIEVLARALGTHQTRPSSTSWQPCT